MKTSNYKNYIEIFYTVLLSSTFGGTLIVGAIVAPSIFGSEYVFADEVLTKFQEGLLMTSIFLKFNYILNFVVATILILETINYKNGVRDSLTLSTIFVFISTSLLFTNYYTPQILEIQSSGLTDGEIFEHLHFASELDFKILSLALLVLTVKKMLSFKQR